MADHHRDTRESTWLARVWASDVPLSICRSTDRPVHDSLVRKFLAAILDIPGSMSHEVEFFGGTVRHVVAVRFEGPTSLEWNGDVLDSAAPFYVVREAMASESILTKYTVQWKRPRDHVHTDRIRQGRLAVVVEQWSDRSSWSPDDVGPFVSIDHFFNGNGNQDSIYLPLWPRVLVLSEVAALLRAANAVPGVEQVLVEIGSPLPSGSQKWPIAGDLAVVGEVDSDALFSFWKRRGLLKADARIGPSLDVAVLDPDREAASVTTASHSIWSSPQLLPVWRRSPSV